MTYLFGGLAGLVWGAAAALLNAFISKKIFGKGSVNSVMSLSVAKNIINIASLAIVFLLRKALPFSYEAALIAAAIALSLLNIFFTYSMSKKN